MEKESLIVLQAKQINELLDRVKELEIENAKLMERLRVSEYNRFYAKDDIIVRLY